MRKVAIIYFMSLFTSNTVTASRPPSHHLLDSLGSKLSKAEKLWLFYRAFRANQAVYDSYLAELAIEDFVLGDSKIQYSCPLYNERLTLQNKVDIIHALIGWPGFLSVDTATHSIWFNYVVPLKEYNKKVMKQLAERYAALTYAWLLPHENIKLWTMLVYFEKQNKRRIKPFCHRVYNYVGEVYFHFRPDPTFDEALSNQLNLAATL